MTYGVIVRVPAPIEAYDASHAAIVEAVGDREIPGFILHTARAADDGFEVIEVWESKDHYDAFTRDVVGPAMAAAGLGDVGPPPAPTEFEPRAVMAVSYAS
jgi:quinol monooxygenase YgiN